MSEFNIEVAGGSSVRLQTAGKYCDRDIIVTATGSGDGNDDILLKDFISNKNNYSIDDDEITSCIGYTFYGSTKLQTLRMTELTSIPVGFCYGASSVTSVDLPKASGKIGNNAFQNCSSMTTLNIPKITSFGNYAMQGCSSITKMDFPSTFTGFSGGAAFSSCSNLVTVILRKSDKIVSLSNVNNFTGTPIANGTGYVYVPSALLASYQSNTNWANYSAQLRTIEDYPDICG